MSEHFDLLIRGATVVDGTGARGYAADVGVRGDRIVHVGPLARAGADVEIDASGKVAAPGFIDAHTHDDRLLLSGPEMTPKVSQGVTTVVSGNCGISLAPAPTGMRAPVTPPLDLLDGEGGWFHFPSFGAYVEELRAHPPAINCAALVGHTTLRVVTLSDVNRPANGAEIAHMRGMIQEALAAGAIGVSTGLYYEPAAAAPTEEVIEVCRPLREFGGLYVTHMRNEGERVMDSLEESFRIGREVGVPVVISHHKVAGTANHGRSKETLAFIAQHMRGQPIGLDCYPYSASSTVLSVERVAVASRVLVTWSKTHPEHSGKDLAVVAREMGVTVQEAVARLLPAGGIYFSMDERDVQRILAFGPTMIGSDGLPHDAFPHPRLWATFPRVLGHYSRELGLFSLEQAVHKMTGLTARTFGLEDRGVLRPGAFADITLFDAAIVDEAATFENPLALSRGIDTVVVNGSVAWQHGRGTGTRSGRVLARKRDAA
ncbi:MAG TPA: D-aminoacylase [Burkholderiales bacterium]|nr:D-aminoacylase [Burkholderiales bacterium]